MDDFSVSSIFTGLGMATGFALAGHKIARVSKSVYDRLEPRLGLHMKKRRNSLEDLFGKPISAFTIDTGTRHPNFRPDFHPENLILSEKIISRLVGRDETDTQRKLGLVDFDKNIISIGGAMSTHTSYYVEGYEGDGFYLNKTSGPDLRWQMIYNEDMLKDMGIIKYNQRKLIKDGKITIQKVPQWVVFDTVSNEVVPYESTGDYHIHPLLLRKLPNTIGPSKNEIIFVVEGPHGDVTLGFKKLLEREDIFNEWLRDAKRYDYFESKFRVKVSRQDVAEPIEIKYQDTEEITKLR